MEFFSGNYVTITFDTITFDNYSYNFYIFIILYISYNYVFTEEVLWAETSKRPIIILYIFCIYIYARFSLLFDCFLFHTSL